VAMTAVATVAHREEAHPSRIKSFCMSHFECSPYIDEPSRYIESITLSTP
jgi:hypothetical protein